MAATISSTAGSCAASNASSSATLASKSVCRGDSLRDRGRDRCRVGVGRERRVERGSGALQPREVFLAFQLGHAALERQAGQAAAVRGQGTRDEHMHQPEQDGKRQQGRNRTEHPAYRGTDAAA